MHAIFSSPVRLAYFVLISMGLSSLSTAQLLTPGAAAIGGVTTDAPLIAPGGQTVQGGPAPATVPVVAETARTVHLPDPSWEIILPPKRGNRGGSGGTVTAAVTPQASSITTDSSSNTSVSQQTSITSAPAEPTTPATAAVSSENTTTEVTAGAAEPVAPSTQTDTTVAVETAVASSDGFERAALNFGPESVDLTAQHEIALDPVITLMRANPLEPLRVAAVLALADASDEDAKLKARQRILKVRRYLIEQGVNAENLSFVISANSATEPFANHVLIERVDN